MRDPMKETILMSGGGSEPIDLQVVLKPVDVACPFALLGEPW